MVKGNPTSEWPSRSGLPQNVQKPLSVHWVQCRCPELRSCCSQSFECFPTWAPNSKFCLPCKGPTTSNISTRHQMRGKAGLLMLSFLSTALCLMLTPDQHYLPFRIPAVPHDVTGCQGEPGTTSLGFGINSKHRRTTEAQGHLHHVNTQAKCVLNMPRTQALLIHIKTKNLAVMNTKTRMMCTFPPIFQL